VPRPGHCRPLAAIGRVWDPSHLIVMWRLLPPAPCLPTAPPSKRAPPIIARPLPSPLFLLRASRGHLPFSCSERVAGTSPSRPLASRPSPMIEARRHVGTLKKCRCRPRLLGEHRPRLFSTASLCASPPPLPILAAGPHRGHHRPSERRRRSRQPLPAATSAPSSTISHPCELHRL
jgi:hypothetical protein